MITFRVHGTPAPQGSKRHVGKGVMIESSAKVKPWREAVKAAALDASYMGSVEDRAAMITGPVSVNVLFIFPRPKSHYGTGKNADVIKANAPEWVTTKPDIDKCERAILDALTDAGIWRDDSQVVRVEKEKIYGDAINHPGAIITVKALP